MNVRIAVGVDVPLGAIEPRRYLQHRHVVARHQVPRLSRLNPAVGSLTKNQRQPADLEVRAGAHEQLGAPGLCHQAGAGLNSMRVLQARRR